MDPNTIINNAEVSSWLKLDTLKDVVSLLIGFLGLLFAIVSYFWNRKESRLEALSQTLEPIVSCMQHLSKANNSRRKCEDLKFSYPDPNSFPEAWQSIGILHKDYSDAIQLSEKMFRESERMIATRKFRFPESISKQLKKIQDSLSEYGGYVNEGAHKKADLKLAQCRDDYQQITKKAKGWRLSGPFEKLNGFLCSIKINSKNNNVVEDKYDLTQEKMDGVLDLVYKRINNQPNNSFAVHPPQIVVDNPDILNSDNVIKELKNSVFSIVFQDGTKKLLSLVELMVFVYNLIFVAKQQEELSRISQGDHAPFIKNVSVKFQICVNDIMRPETVKALMQKIEFSNVSSDKDN